MYGTAFAFHGAGGNGTLEGVFSAKSADGDTYGSYSAGRVADTAGHGHSCSTIGGYRVRSQASWDRDSENLTYKVIRNGNAAAPVYTARATSQFRNRPSMTFTNCGLVPGARYGTRSWSATPAATPCPALTYS